MRARGSHKGYDEEILCKWLLSKALFDEFRVNLVQQYV